jgi:hypothetical protein
MHMDALQRHVYVACLDSGSGVEMHTDNVIDSPLCLWSHFVHGIFVDMHILLIIHLYQLLVYNNILSSCDISTLSPSFVRLYRMISVLPVSLHIAS